MVIHKIYVDRDFPFSLIVLFAKRKRCQYGVQRWFEAYPKRLAANFAALGGSTKCGFREDWI